jgi:predicted TIM-barrel enzyme
VLREVEALSGPDNVAGARQSGTDPRDAAIATRYVFVGYDARTQPDLEAACRVTIRRGAEVISGTGNGPSTTLGRAQAAARAVFAAIAAARRDDMLGLEGATLVETHGRAYVLVAAHAAEGRESLPLTGAAALHRSPEEAAILASLQATNRWAELDG